MWEFKFNEQVKITQSCPTLCDPMDCSLPCSSAHGILQARVPEWVVVLFSRGSSQPRDQPSSPALQADLLLSEPLGNPKNTGVGGLIPSPGDLPDSGIKPGSPALQADSLLAELPGKSYVTFSSVQFSCSVVSDSLRPHELQHARPPCPSPSPGVHSNSHPSSQ